MQVYIELVDAISLTKDALSTLQSTAIDREDHEVNPKITRYTPPCNVDLRLTTSMGTVHDRLDMLATKMQASAVVPAVS